MDRLVIVALIAGSTLMIAACDSKEVKEAQDSRAWTMQQSTARDANGKPRIRTIEEIEAQEKAKAKH